MPIRSSIDFLVFCSDIWRNGLAQHLQVRNGCLLTKSPKKLSLPKEINSQPTSNFVESGHPPDSIYNLPVRENFFRSAIRTFSSVLLRATSRGDIFTGFEPL